MTQEKKDGLEAFRKWLTPLLIVIVGALMTMVWNGKADRDKEREGEISKSLAEIKEAQKEISKKVEAFNSLQITVSNLTLRLDQVNEKVSDLKSQVDDMNYGNKVYNEAQKRLNRKL